MTIRMILALLLVLSLTGCSDPGVRNTPEKPSYPLESFPETSQETIDPLVQPETVVIAVQPSLSGDMAENTTALNPTLVEDELLALINASRSQASLDMLEAEETLLWAARLRATELQTEFGHTRPNGASYYTVFDEVGFSYSGKWHGENASRLSFASGLYDEKEIAALMYQDLLKSEGHSRNMNRTQYGLAGVGTAIEEKNGEIIVTSSQLFASR